MTRKKRIALVLLGLTLVAGIVLLSQPYPRQLVFGPKVKGVPLCAWQEYFREGHAEDLWIEPSAFQKLLGWLKRGSEPLNWGELTPADKEVIHVSLIDDADPNIRYRAFDALGTDRPGRVPAILRLLEDPDVSVIEKVAKSLIGEDLDPRVKEQLERLAEGNDAHRRDIALRVLHQQSVRRDAPKPE
jgi:HEAT repeats